MAASRTAERDTVRAVPRPPVRTSDMSRHILPTSATMVGVCITVIGIVRLLETHAAIATIIDNVLAVDAMFFLMSTVVSYVALRTTRDTPRLEHSADLLFLAGLALMVASGVMLAWELGQTRLPPA